MFSITLYSAENLYKKSQSLSFHCSMSFSYHRTEWKNKFHYYYLFQRDGNMHHCSASLRIGTMDMSQLMSSTTRRLNFRAFDVFFVMRYFVLDLILFRRLNTPNNEIFLCLFPKTKEKISWNFFARKKENKGK